MKLLLGCIGLLIVVLFVSAGCVPIGVPVAMSDGDTRGGVVPTPTSPVSPLPTPTSQVSPLPTPTSPVSPLAAPAMGQAGKAGATVEYVVRRGDTLGKIAAKFGVKVSAILSANRQVKSADRIWVGQRLRIPTK